MAVMRRALGALAVLLVVAGCGATTTKAEKPKTPASSTPAALTMVQVCPQLEAAMPSDPGPLVPRGEWSALYAKLGELSRASDLETRNAIDQLRPAVDTYLHNPSAGEQSVDAWRGLTEAVQTLADRCQAAGSSAFQ